MLFYHLINKSIISTLKESEEHFRNAIENTDAGYIFIDKDGIVRATKAEAEKKENDEEFDGITTE